jgi:hypothetical protein
MRRLAEAMTFADPAPTIAKVDATGQGVLPGESAPLVLC